MRLAEPSAPAGPSGGAGAGRVALSAQDLQALPVLFRVDLTRGVPAREDLLGIIVAPRASGPVRPRTRPRAAFPPYSGASRAGSVAARPAHQHDDRPDDQGPEDERG